ncbi:Hypothetical protein SRAE_2000355500 [Strongyloides ratti]|uniref:Uncharacterized protein n=1 Tax=Strongyloides ratti TaxID=34506 RepID=A0A090LGG8_STRRB|nr:Hypothetical protein SRAE_2000355500 [Strongyloides ratti]CEF68901.1 Hypothetical protein SRAE_2000355500 [Strongyloides ratti]
MKHSVSPPVSVIIVNTTQGYLKHKYCLLGITAVGLMTFAYYYFSSKPKQQYSNIENLKDKTAIEFSTNASACITSTADMPSSNN